MDLIRDPLWQFIGALLALLGIVAAIAIYFKQRQRKQFSYRTDTNASLVTVSDVASGRITVAYDGKPVSNVRLFEITFANTGNMPIASADYERPVSIEFLEKAKVLSVEIVDQTPENLGVTLTLEAEKVAIAPVLLNKGDSYTVKATVSDSVGKYRLDARIIGVSRLSPMTDRRRVFEVAMWGSGALIGAAASMFAALVASKELMLKNIGMMVGLVLSGIAMVAYDFVISRRKAKMSRTSKSSVQ